MKCIVVFSFLLAVTLHSEELPPPEGEPTTPSYADTVLTSGDLPKIKKRLSGGKAHWKNDKGYQFQCADKICSVSCEPMSDAVASDKELVEGSKYCWIRVPSDLLSQMQRLMARAKEQNAPQADDAGVVSCEATACTIHHKK